jgi:Ca-activated chloride channel family protein
MGAAAVSFLRPEFLTLGALVSVLVSTAWWAHARRRRRLAEFLGGRRAAARLSPRSNLYRFQVERLALVGGAVLAVAAAAAEPEGWDTSGPGVPERSVVFAIDVSASMQASDITPTRLDRAVQVADELIARIGDQRVGLVLFAGTTYTLAPPTRDIATVRHFLSGVTATIASAHDPGTRMTAAIREAASQWNQPTQPGEVRSIVLISDGDGGDEGEAVVEEARAAAARGMYVHVVGVGTERGSGMMMPPAPYQMEGPVLTETGSPATSRLDEALLTRIADAGVGRYARADDRGEVDDLGDWLTPAPLLASWRLHYDLPFLLIALALLALLVESLLGVRAGLRAALSRRSIA